MECFDSIAVNLIDLERIDNPLIFNILLGGKLDESEVVVTDSNLVDEMAVRFTCDLLTAACCCDTLRTKDRRLRRHPTRVYLRRAEAWNKIAGNDVLVKCNGDKMELNPDLFKVVYEPVKVISPPPKKVSFSKKKV